MYRYTDDTEESRQRMGLTDEDKPLPFELKDRVNKYIERRTREGAESYKRDINRSSSFNALVRQEIRAGRL